MFQNELQLGIRLIIMTLVAGIPASKVQMDQFKKDIQP